MTVSINCPFDRIESLGRQAISGLYLQGIIVIMIIDEERPILLVGSTVPWAGHPGLSYMFIHVECAGHWHAFSLLCLLTVDGM